jgi:hypothetical protein
VVADASKASAKVKEEVNMAPGRGKEVEKRGEQYAHQAGAKLDSAVCFLLQSHGCVANRVIDC